MTLNQLSLTHSFGYTVLHLLQCLQGWKVRNYLPKYIPLFKKHCYWSPFDYLSNRCLMVPSYSFENNQWLQTRYLCHLIFLKPLLEIFWWRFCIDLVITNFIFLMPLTVGGKIHFLRNFHEFSISVKGFIQFHFNSFFFGLDSINFGNV